MASDRGVAPLLRADELEMRWLGGADWLHVTGYALFRSPIDEAADQKRACSTETIVLVHGTIVGRC